MVNKLDIEGIYFDVIMVIYDKPTTNIKLRSDKLKTFLLASRIRHGTLPYHRS